MKLERLIPHGGICYVCGENTLIAFFDPITQRRVGKCCVKAFEFAGAMLSASLKVAGLCHPDKEACE